MIKAILFDCFGVLTTDTWKAFLSTLPAGTDIDAARQVHRAYAAGLISKQVSAQQIQAITGHTFTELEDALDAKVAKNTVLLDDIRELKKHYKIGLISNIGSNWIRESFLTDEEQKLFDAMILSFEVGTVKPDPQIFHVACQRLGVEPNETILVDDVDRYCTAAQELGMKAIVYQDYPQAKAELKKLLADANH